MQEAKQEKRRALHLQDRMLNVQKTCIPPGTGMEACGGGGSTQVHFFLSILPDFSSGS